MDYKKTAIQIFEKFGDNNINHITHCETRLRVTVNDLTKVREEEIKEIPGVLGIVKQGNTVQVVLGTVVNKVYDEFIKVANIIENTPTKNRFSVYSIIGYIADVFLPILPVIIVSGLISAVLTILTLTTNIDTSSGTYQVLSAMSNAGFNFLPILIGYSAAKRSHVNVALGMLLGAILMHSGINDVAGLDFFGITIVQTSYASSAIPVIMGVLFMAVIQPIIQKIVPRVFKETLEPLLIMLIATPVTLIILGPAGVIAGNWLANSLVWINTNLGWFSLTLVGAIFGFIVIFGLNKALIPILVASFASFGYEGFWMPAMLATNIAIGGAALGMFVMQKDPNEKALSLSTGVTGLMGITEPALYGVLLPNKTALIGSIIGGAVGGTVAGLTKLVQYSIVSGLPAIPTFIPPQGDVRGMENLYFGILVIVVSATVGFAATIILEKMKNRRKVDA